MLSFLSNKRQPGWMSILPHSGGVTLARVLRRAHALPCVERLETFASGSDLAEALRRLRAAAQLQAHACTTLLPAGDYALVPLDAPAVPPEERREALRWALKDVVAFPIEGACLGVLELPEGCLGPGRTPGVLAVTADEAAVRRVAEPFEAAQVPLAVIDVPELAQRNVAALLEDENRGLVLLRIDADAVMLTLTWRGELVAVRRREDGDFRAFVEGSLPASEAMIERLVLELQRSLDNFDRQYSHVAISRVVVAAPVLPEAMLAALAASSFLPVERMNLSGVLDLGCVPALSDPGEQARHLLALGAALRDEGAA